MSPKELYHVVGFIYGGGYYYKRINMETEDLARSRECYVNSSNCNMKSFISILLVVSIFCVEWMNVFVLSLDCIHGTWFPSDTIANYGFCRCYQKWSGPPEFSSYCVYGPQNFIDLYSSNHTCDRACPWTFTSPNLHCTGAGNVIRSCNPHQSS
jgi:hypothetical protein